MFYHLQVTERTKLNSQDESCSVLLCIRGTGKLHRDGQAKEIKPGSIIFLPFDPSAATEVVPDSGDVLLYEAFATP